MSIPSLPAGMKMNWTNDYEDDEDADDYEDEDEGDGPTREIYIIREV